MRERRCYYVYLLTNVSYSTFYVGVTNALFRRVDQHREGKGDAFTARYNVGRLIYCERYSWIDRAIAREKQLKGWRREKKIRLARSANPSLEDMRDYGTLVFGDSYVAKIARKHLRIVFDPAKRRSFGEGSE